MENQSPDSIGLCLSGGGFRASLFHLGVHRYLAEAGQLSNVSAISTVSGGSIIGAFLATRWDGIREAGYSPDGFMREVYDPFRQRVSTRNPRNRWLLLLLPRWLTSDLTRLEARIEYRVRMIDSGEPVLPVRILPVLSRRRQIQPRMPEQVLRRWRKQRTPARGPPTPLPVLCLCWQPAGRRHPA